MGQSKELKRWLEYEAVCLPMLVTFVRPAKCFVMDPESKEWKAMSVLKFIPASPSRPDLSPRVLDANHGLLVLKNLFQDFVYVCNPVTGAVRKLPPMLGCTSPKVVHVVAELEEKSFRVYVISFLEDSVWGGWKKLPAALQHLDNGFSRVEVFHSAPPTADWEAHDWKLLPSKPPASPADLPDFLCMPLCLRSVHLDGIIYCLCQKRAGPGLECCLLGYDTKASSWRPPCDLPLKLGWFPDVVACDGHVFLVGFHPSADQHRYEKDFNIYRFVPDDGSCCRLEAQAPPSVIQALRSWDSLRPLAFASTIFLLSPDCQHGFLYHLLHRCWQEWSSPSPLPWPRDKASELYPFAPDISSAHVLTIQPRFFASFD